MSDTTAEQARWQFRAYHEDREHAALRGQSIPPPEPLTVARQQLALAVRAEGYVIDLDSVREEESQDVVVNEEQTDYRLAAEGEKRTGRLVLWSATGHPRIGTDADDPILYVTRDDDLDVWVAKVPEPQATVGGSCRIRHERNANVTVLAFKPDGEGIGYLFATTLDKDTVHVEFFGGTAAFHITED